MGGLGRGYMSGGVGCRDGDSVGKDRGGGCSGCENNDGGFSGAR